MELRIVIDDLEPPCGHATVDGREAWRFVGWLELIEKVERLKDENGGGQPRAESGRVP
jgi:hypothetical protein